MCVSCMWKIFANSYPPQKKNCKASNQNGWLFMTLGFKSSWRILCCAQCTQCALQTSVCKTPDRGEHIDDFSPTCWSYFESHKNIAVAFIQSRGKTNTHYKKKQGTQFTHRIHLKKKKNYTQLNVHVYKIFSTSCKYVIIFRFY